MANELLPDYRWLLSDDAARWLERLRNSSAPLVSQARQLRKNLSAAQTHLLLEQIQLRQRGAAKFEAAERMFFTSRALEQATDQWIATYKATRFPPGGEFADLCCGVGGDLSGMACQGRATGIDADPIVTLLAERNCRVWGLAGHRIETTDATRVPLEAFVAWHVDPDRRVEGQRTTRLSYSQPSLPALEQMLQRQRNAAVKLAPATTVPPAWAATSERQWIGSGRECRQQVLWFGQLAQHPGQHSAQVVHRRQSSSVCLVGTPDTTTELATHLADFVCEPHAVVLAARLTGALARRHGLQALDAHVPYLTSTRPIHDPLLSCFAVIDSFPFDVRKLRAVLRNRHIGRLEVKKRGVPLDPDTIRRQLEGKGDESATLLVTPHAGSTRAVLCQRLEH